jgi:hypothetical protein
LNGNQPLTGGEIMRLVNEYIGVHGGYLGDFTYATHEEFYPVYCDLDIDPSEYPGTTRLRFIHILRNSPSDQQARIIRGVLDKYPVGSDERRTQALADRFRAVAARIEGNIVNAPNPAATRDVVLRALQDAETMIREGSPVSAVDRVHTALHGHLHHLCDSRAVPVPERATINQLFNTLRQNVPELQPVGPRAGDLVRVLRSSGAILDAMNPLRNNATMAHPTEDLLDDAEAMLAVNVMRSLLAYLDAKLGM